MATYEVTAPDGSVYEIEGADDADPSALVAQISGQSSASAQPNAEPTIGAQVARQLGLTSRAAIEGIGSLAALPSDALFAAINLIHHYRGEPMPYTLASQSIRQGLTAAGLPEPATGSEKFASAVESGLAGGGAMTGVGRAIAGSATPIVSSIGESLAANPAAQATGAVTGTAAQQTAAALGAPVPVQIAAGLAGGMAGGAAVPTTTAGARGLAAAAEPVTEAGRRAIAGRVIRTAATDAEQAASDLENARSLVPGSAPTAGEAARDIGLAAFQQRLRGIGETRFNVRASEQNQARQTLLDSVAEGGTPEAIQRLTARRDAVTRPLRESAFSQAQGNAVDSHRVVSDIDALMADPENAGRSVQQALKSIRDQISPENGPPLTDARALYAVRKEINRILEGKYVGAEESVLRYAGGQLARVRSSIDDAISEVAPDWRNYLTKYAQLSQPINRAETIGDVRTRTGLAAPDLRTGRDVLSQAKWKSVVDRALPDLNLTQGQQQKLRAIGADLDRGAAAIAAAKTGGSDTAANLATKESITVANILGRVTGKPISSLSPSTRTLARPLSFLYKLPDEAVRELIVDAMLDPKLAAQLIREGTTENIQSFADALRESSRAATTGAASGSASQAGAR